MQETRLSGRAMKSMGTIRIKRVYEEAGESDGFRVLVDRIWPRGVSKERARIEVWLKSVAPSTALRKWFGHDPEKWPEFKRRYFRELDEKPPGVADLIQRARKEDVTLIYSARDREHNQAVALKEYLDKQFE